MYQVLESSPTPFWTLGFIEDSHLWPHNRWHDEGKEVSETETESCPDQKSNNSGNYTDLRPKVESGPSPTLFQVESFGVRTG